METFANRAILTTDIIYITEADGITRHKMKWSDVETFLETNIDTLADITSLALGTSASPLTCTTGTPLVSIYSTSSNTTSTNTEPFYFKSVMTGVNGYGGRAVFHAYTNVAMQTNLQAIRAYVEYGVAGYIKGNSAALNAEIKMPNADISSVGGAFNVLKLEYTAGGTTTKTAGGLNGNHSTWMRLNTSGDTDGDFDDNGFFAVVTGLTAGATHLLSANSQTLRIGIGTTTTKYLFLSGAEDSLDIGSCATGINFSGTITKGIDFSSVTPTFGTDNAFINIGNWTTGYNVTSQTQHFVPLQIHLDSNTSVAKDLACARFRVDTDAASTLTSLTTLQLRSSISHNVAAMAGINCSVNVDDAVTIQTGELVVGYFSLDGTGALTNAGSNESSAIVASVTNTGAAITNGVWIRTAASTEVTNGLQIINGGTMTNGIVIDSATTGITVTDATLLGVSVSIAALTAGDSYSGVRSVVNCANANNSYGASGYFDATLTGTQAGTFVYGLGSWINLSTYTTSGIKYICAQDNGVYQGADTGEIADARVVFGMRMESIITATDHLNFPFSINTDNSGITAIFDVNTTSDLGIITDAGADDGTLIPILRDNSGNMRYVKVYTTA